MHVFGEADELREADLVAEAVLDANGRVLVTVPANLDGNYVLTLFATWSDERAAHGDAAYYAPIRFEQ